MTKKKYYKKNHADCFCCGWQGMVKNNTRAWLGRNDKQINGDYE